MPTLYGLESCKTCDKARAWLARRGIAHRFVDYRSDPVAPAVLEDWAGQLGGFDKLVNRTSTTWRNLPPNRKSPGSVPEWKLLIREYPALVKRPVTVTEDGAITVGFTDKQYALRFGK